MFVSLPVHSADAVHIALKNASERTNFRIIIFQNEWINQSVPLFLVLWKEYVWCLIGGAVENWDYVKHASGITRARHCMSLLLVGTCPTLPTQDHSWLGQSGQKYTNLKFEYDVLIITLVVKTLYKSKHLSTFILLVPISKFSCEIQNTGYRIQIRW